MKIKAKSLSKKYNNRVVVDDVSFEIRPGQILGLLGPNGAGKSTTIKMLTGQTNITSGEVEIDGKIQKSIPPEMRGNIGVMPQEIIIWDELNIKENLEFTAKIQEMEPKLAKERVNYLIDALSMKKELKTLAKNLSGGYKRRLNLAISIIHDPSLVFLDEPSPGIDPQSRRFLWDFIKTLRDENKAVVLTDHYLEEAEKLSDYVVIIDEGKVIAEGTVDELKKEYGDGNFVRINLDDSTSKAELNKLESLLNKKYDSVKVTGSDITIFTKEGVKAVEDGLECVNSLSLVTNDISIKEPTLEDIFLILTGKDLRE